MNPFAAWLLLFGACDQAVERYDRAAIVRHLADSSNARGGQWRHCCSWRLWEHWPNRVYLGTHLYWYVPSQSHRDAASVDRSGYRAHNYEDWFLGHTPGNVPP